MDYIREKIFMASSSKHILFILDCCHSGAFSPQTLRDKVEHLEHPLIDHRFFSGGTGRIAIFSCPHNASSRESASLENGVFTYYLLQGLLGEASEAETGEVTLDSLLSYVRSRSPAEQPPGRYGADFGRIVLTTPGKKEQQNKTEDLELSLAGLEKFSTPQINPLSNPLEPFKSFINKLAHYVSEIHLASKTYIENKALEAIRCISEADFIFVLRIAGDAFTIKSQSEFNIKNISRSEYIENIVSRLGSTILSKAIFSKDCNGIYLFCDEGIDTGKAYIIIPLKLGETIDIMVVCGLVTDSFLLNDIYARILATLYSASKELTSMHTEKIEAAILDDLKKTYGFVPLDMYKRRFNLFNERIAQISAFFEPILYLEPKHLHICGWEALARDPKTMLCPFDLFTAAELWGEKYMIEIDLHMLRLACSSYYKERLITPGRRRPEDILKLSINVYPNSLIHKVYFEEIKKVLNEGLIPPEKLVLEISEKYPIPEIKNGTKQEPLTAFREKLENYVHNLHISFALDDFGTGYSSVSRLARLRPSHVKIDRDVLLHEYIDPTIRYVFDLLRKKRLEPPTVIVEGFDKTSHISLHRLYNLGVRYVQGYMIGIAGPELRRLEPEIRDFIQGLLKENQHQDDD